MDLITPRNCAFYRCPRLAARGYMFCAECMRYERQDGMPQDNMRASVPAILGPPPRPYAPSVDHRASTVSAGRTIRGEERTGWREIAWRWVRAWLLTMAVFVGVFSVFTGLCLWVAAR